MKKVLVVGGGLAGIAAAAALAGENHSVTLIERRRILGGRASAFPLESGWLDNCQHVILGSCINLLDLLDRLKTRSRITFYSGIPFFRNGKATVLRGSFLPAPLHFLPAFLTSPLFSLREKMSLLNFFVRAMKLDPQDAALDQISVRKWLESYRQSPETIENFWNLVFISSLNETLDRAAAKYGLMVLRESFLADRRGAWIGAPNVSLAELYHESAKNIFAQHGVEIVHAGAKALHPGEDAVKVVLEDNRVFAGDELISTVPFYNLRPLLPEAVRDDPFFTRFEKLETSPILGIHLWFDRPLSRHPFGAFSGSPIHWFFSKPKHDGSYYIQLVVSAGRNFMEWTTEDLVRLGLGEIEKHLPPAARANLLEAKVVRETRATFSCRPGCDGLRPAAETPLPRFYLAGDWTATGWPATMEGAVISGYRAAEAILKRGGRPKNLERRSLDKGKATLAAKKTVS